MIPVTRTPSSTADRRRKPLSRTLAGALAVLALTGATAATAAPATAAPAATTKNCSSPDFTDVRTGSTFHTAITWLRCEGISRGYSDGTYRTGQLITRGEAAQLLYRYSGQDHSAGTRKDFTDVTPGASAFTAVSWMKEKGYTTGYSDGSFGVQQPITRGELAAFLYRMSGKKASAPATSPYTDVDAGDTFYAPAAWFRSTGLIAGYADGSFRPDQDVSRGESAKFLYALESRVNGAPPAYQVPTPVSSSAVNATGGSGGTYRDAQAITYGNGTVSSQYHLYAGHLNGSKPHGIMIHLHGDGGWEYRDQKWSFIPDYLELARQHNLMLVVPHTPDRSSNTWWRKDSSGQYAADLLKDLGKKYNLDLNQVYWTGYSGGADTVAEQMMNSHSAGWTGGAAVIVAGGGVYGQSKPLRPISEALKNNFQMHWVVGGDDSPAAGGASGSYDAVRAAKLGREFYTKQGLTTSLTVKPGMDHWEIQDSGPQKLAQVLAGR
jgi:poly(3-hydroxybutyrate) depolymerase